MLKVFYKGGSDIHRVDVGGRLVQFTRADDEALPYASVSEQESLALDPALFVVPSVEPKADEAPGPVRRGRKPKAEG